MSHSLDRSPNSVPNRLLRALLQQNEGSRPPIWFMRQAGRYHSHYQAIKKQHSFLEMCKQPDLACEITMGPIRDFDFDAAILFSDLLFPLEAMGMGLDYTPGPKLGFHLKSLTDLDRLQIAPAEMAFGFQRAALQKIRAALPTEKGLLGFVGAPLTLFFYAVAGSHQRGGEQSLEDVFLALEDGRYEAFLKILEPLLVENMMIQAQGSPDAIALFDTCAGEIPVNGGDLTAFRHAVLAPLKRVVQAFRDRVPHMPLVYYSRGTGPVQWQELARLPPTDLPIECLGIDWRHSLTTAFEAVGGRFSIQGNLDPDALLQPWSKLEAAARSAWQVPEKFRRSWVCGLGHGVLPTVPESNVRQLISLQAALYPERRSQ